MDIYKIKIGDTITPYTVYELAKHFKLDYIIKRLQNSNAEKYKPFTFDGLSCLPDELVSFLLKLDHKKLTYLAALPHDIAYYVGELDNEIERERVDIKFKSNLITKCDMPYWIAELFCKAVRIGGSKIFGQSFSWGFGRR